MRLAALVVLVLSVAACADTTPKVPAFKVVAEEGAVEVSIVVSPAVAADDAGLLAIADSLLPTKTGRSVMLEVWTDEAMVPARIEEMSDVQLKARKAVVKIDLNTGYRKVER